MAIIIKSPSEIGLMRQAGKIVAATLQVIVRDIKPGVVTAELDAIAVREIQSRGGIPSFKGYRGYPASLCVSINDELVHGIPGQRALREGDIVSLDVGAIYNGFHGDAAVTVGVGQIGEKAKRLLVVTEEALRAGIAAARHGARLGDVSAAIQEHVESREFTVVREYVGHGIGRQMHEEPQIPNFGLPGRGPLLKEGMAVALEPMVNVGGWRTKVDDDGWTVRTADGSLCAHFEHTIVITDGEAEILTAL
ncbi:MAG: type I methionyl aminopeptidase [Chloroflexi bacterium RBG_13_54_9]|nr:MAG: type I methionyl aminopeptidase [Chloroflexi bacterium RBG_13_54_9]